MIDNECNILNNMSKQDFRECRSLLIDMVLHTGMTSIHIVTIPASHISRYVDAFLSVEADEGNPGQLS